MHGAGQPAAAMQPKLFMSSVYWRGIQRLRAIAERVVGVMMHFHEQTVRARRHRRARHRRHLIAASGAMRRIGHHRQVRKLFHHRNRGHVERIARVGFEGADAALAQNHFVIAARKNVFGGEQQFLNGRGLAALQQDRLANAPQFAQQIEILHVARAHLQNVRVCREQRDLGGIHHFADDQQAAPVGRFAHHLQALFAQPLKAVRRRAGFEGAAANHARAAIRHDIGRALDLIAIFHAARASHHHHALPPISTSLIFTTVPCGRNPRLASLYGETMR